MEVTNKGIKSEPSTPSAGMPIEKARYHPATSKWSNWSGAERPGRNVKNNDTNRLPNQRPG